MLWLNQLKRIEINKRNLSLANATATFDFLANSSDVSEADISTYKWKIILCQTEEA